MKGSRRSFAFVLIAALAVVPTVLGTVSVSAVVASEDGKAAGQPSEDLWEEFPLDPGDQDAGDTVGDREPGPGRTGESESQPADEGPARDPEVTETRFTADRIITAAVLQALLLALIAGLILYRRSARRRGDDVVEGAPARTLRGGRPKSKSRGRRSSSSRSPGRLESVHARHGTRRAPASIGAPPGRDSSGYLCLSLTDGRTIEGSLRGKEGNGQVLIVDVDYVIEPDGTRRRGSVEDAFVPVSTIERPRKIEGPRSA